MRYIIIFIAMIALASCGQTSPPETTEAAIAGKVKLTEAQLKNIDLQTATWQTKMVSTAVKLNGKIEVPPQNLISISAPLGGYIKSTKLLPGMPIRKGEVLATMEDQQYIQLQSDYLATQAKWQLIAKDYDRQKELNETKATSDKVFQQTQSDYTLTKVQLKSLAEKLRLIGIDASRLTEQNLSGTISITAPIDGFVSGVNVNIGKYVQPTDVLFELVNPSDIHLALTVFEKDVNKLSIGQQVLAYTNNQPDKKYKAKILLIGKDFVNDKSVLVHCHFDKYDKLLLPGMYMNAEVEVSPEQQEVVPDEAIVTYEGNHYVFVAIDKLNFEMVEVEVGSSTDGLTAISSVYLSPNHQIVVKGAYPLLMTAKNISE